MPTMPTTPTNNNSNIPIVADAEADADRQQQQQQQQQQPLPPMLPPLPPMLQQLLDIHCHLTNQPYLLPDHQSPSIPLPSCVAVLVEPKRFNRSRTQIFYILDSPSRRLQFPTIYLIGSTGNLYKVSFHISGVRCNCPDTATFCKHVLFILSVSRLMTSSRNTFYLNMESTINQLQTVDFSNSMVDATTNSICCHSINLPCTVCRDPMRREFLICSKCFGVSHKTCAKRQIETRCGYEGNGAKSFPTPTLCFLCHRPWMPFTVGCSGKYRNLSMVLKHFKYPLATIGASVGQNLDQSAHSCPSSGNHKSNHNSNQNNIDNIHFQSSSTLSSSTLNRTGGLQRPNDGLDSAKRTLTYPSPEQRDSASPNTASSVTQSRSPESPSLEDFVCQRTGKRPKYEPKYESI